MKIFKELIITIAFLALYTPLSIAIWYTTGKTANLWIVALIGLSIITLYIYFELASHKFRRILRQRFRSTTRTFVRLKECPETDEEEAELQDPLIGFRTLFSQNNQPGGEAI